MKAPCSLPSLLTILLFTVSAATPAQTPGDPLESGNNTENQNPPPAICCRCTSMHVAGVGDGPDQGDGRLWPSANGEYRANVTITYTDSAPPGEECGDHYSVKVTASLRSATGAVHTEEKGTTVSSPLIGTSQRTIPFTLPAHLARMGDTWEFKLDCGYGPVDEDTHEGITTIQKTETNCPTIRIQLGGCSSCSEDGCSSNGSPSAESGFSAEGETFTVRIPTTQSNGGQTEGSLDFFPRTFANPGRAALLANLPAGFTVLRDENDIITSVSTGAATLEVAPAAQFLLDLDPNAFIVTHKDIAGAPFRTTTISFVTEQGVQRFRMDSALTGDPVTRHEQTKDQNGNLILQKGRLNGTDFEPLWQETLTKSETVPGVRIHRRTIQERPTAAATAAWAVVSDVETTWENQLYGWVKTKEIIDPNPGGAQLTSIWEYYQPGGPPTGPGGSTEGLGRLKRHVRHDGYEAFHTYALNYHEVLTPFAGDPTGKATTTTWDPVTKSRTSTTSFGGHILSKTVTAHTATTLTQTVHTSAGQTLVTITHYKPSNEEFGGKPVRSLHPDGTLTTYEYGLTQDGGLQTITTQGSTADQQTVAQGIRTTTETNPRGTTILRETHSIGYDTDAFVLESMAVTQTDFLGRATETFWLPANVTTTTAYSCCGIAMETDQYGIPTFHAYDGLKRRIKTNRLGVTTETHHLGLTTETHRYPEEVENALAATLAGHAGTLIGKTVSNLAGTLQQSWSPDPTSDQPGDLILSSTTTTQYAPGETLSRTVTTTVPGNHKQFEEYFLDGRLFRSYGVLSPAMEYAYTSNATGEITSQSFLNTQNLKLETSTTQTDWAGRILQTAKGTITQTYVYHDNTAPAGSRGQLKSVMDSDNVTTLHAYNGRGERTTTALKLGNETTITPGIDQITISETVPALGVGDIPVWRTISKVSYTSVLSPIVSQTDRTPDGLQSWSWQIGQGPTPADPDQTFTQQGAKYSYTLTTLNGSGDWTTVTTHPDGTTQTQQYTGGLLTSLLSSVSGSSVSYQYDTLKRPWKQTESRTGTTTTEYLSTTADLVKSITDPGNRETKFTYDPRGRRTHVDAPDTFDPVGAPNNTDHENITETIHNPDGTVHEIKGDQTYRVQYGYDYAARMQTMTTFGTETAATTWFYNQATGLLDRKEYHDGNGTSYKYTLGGRLAKRTWQRGVVTDYHYDSGGRQRAIDYSDDTPDVLYTHDAIGRILNEKQGTLSFNSGVPVVASPVRAISYTHDPSTLLPQSETHALGGLIRTLVRSHDGVGRPEKVAAGIDANSDPATLETTDHYTGYFFGTDGRLLGIDAKDLPRFAQKDYGIEYTYSAQSDHLIHTLTRAGSGGAANLVTTHTWDPTRDVLFIKDNRLDAAQDPVSRYDYSNHVNGIGQREKVVTSGTAFGGTNRGWSWGYDKRGQVTVASHGADSELDRSYLFDGIGNRLETTVGDSTAVTTEYDPTPLNQYSSITIGTNNPLAPVHDPDGNLTEDAAHNKNNDDRQYVWDAENRLIAVNKVTGRDETSGEITATSSLVTYAYDSRSRRISRSVGVSPTSTTFYLYDGWNVVAEYTDNGVDPLALNRTYTWGTDLSSSLQGAGGVGGLLAVRVHGGDHAGNYYPTFDGNGNVSEYLTDGGILKAHHEYDPFGNDVTPETAKGDLHGFFSHRFSTKPFDDISGWSYYGYRYYDPVTGRWPSRDPIGEEGGMNLYGFVGNSTIHRVEKLGLHAVDLKLQNAPGYRCSGNFLWAAYAAFFTGLSPSTDYFASYTYTVGYSNTTCSGSTWGWTDLGERTITQRFSTRAGMTKATDTRITPINQGMAAGDRGWATPSIPIDDGRVVIYLKFAIRLYKSNADIATLNLHRPMPNGGPYKSGFDGNNPSDSLSWFNDAFGYGANHSSGFLNSPIPSSAVVVASGTNRLEMHLCCCGTKDDYGNYKARPALEIHDRVSQAFEVPDGVRMKPRK